MEPSFFIFFILSYFILFVFFLLNFWSMHINSQMFCYRVMTTSISKIFDIFCSECVSSIIMRVMALSLLCHCCICHCICCICLKKKPWRPGWYVILSNSHTKGAVLNNCTCIQSHPLRFFCVRFISNVPVFSKIVWKKWTHMCRREYKITSAVYVWAINIFRQSFVLEISKYFNDDSLKKLLPSPELMKTWSRLCVCVERKKNVERDIGVGESGNKYRNIPDFERHSGKRSVLIGSQRGDMTSW